MLMQHEWFVSREPPNLCKNELTSKVSPKLNMAKASETGITWNYYSQAIEQQHLVRASRPEERREAHSLRGSP